MLPKHIAIIPDGNRRWTGREGESLDTAYFEGGRRFIEVVTRCLELGVERVSAFGSSANNVTKRPSEEAQAMHHGVQYVCGYIAGIDPFDMSRSPDFPVSLHLFGDLDTVPQELGRDLFLQLREARAPESRLDVHIGLNYCDEPTFQSQEVPKVDLVIRTGGRHRLSGFLPMQSANAELWFSPVLWPDFSLKLLDESLAWYNRQVQTEGS